VLQVLFQSGRLKISSKLPLAGTLQSELLNFRVKIDPVMAHDSYSARREQDHDDQVLSVAEDGRIWATFLGMIELFHGG